MNTTTNTALHNIKMVVLVLIPILLGVIGILQGQMGLPSWVVTISSILVLIEHSLNGNTPANAAIVSSTATTQ